MQTKILVMTYGTLMNGQSNHTWMEQAGGEFIDYATSEEPSFAMIGINKPAAFPAVILGHKKFQGELYLVPEEGILRELDSLEGYPHMYDRAYINVITNKGDKCKALVYYMSNSQLLNIDETNISWKDKRITENDSIYKWA